MSETDHPISEEELELNAYLGQPEVSKICDFIGSDGKDIVAAAWRDGFHSGASAVEAAIDQTHFDSHIVLKEVSGRYAGDTVSLRAVLIEDNIYLSEGFNHNEQEHFDTQMLSKEALDAVCDVARGYSLRRDYRDPGAITTEEYKPDARYATEENPQ